MQDSKFKYRRYKFRKYNIKTLEEQHEIPDKVDLDNMKTIKNGKPLLCIMPAQRCIRRYLDKKSTPCYYADYLYTHFLKQEEVHNNDQFLFYLELLENYKKINLLCQG